MKKAISSVLAMSLVSTFAFAAGPTNRELYSSEQALDAAKKQEIMSSLIQNDQIHIDVEYKNIKSGFRGNGMVSQKAEALKRSAEKVRFNELRPLQAELESATSEAEKKAISNKIFVAQKKMEAFLLQNKTLMEHLELIEKARAAGKETITITQAVDVKRVGDPLAAASLDQDMWPTNAKIKSVKRMSVNDLNNLKKMNATKNLTKGIIGGLTLVGAGTAGYFMMNNTEVKAKEDQESFEKAKSSVRLRDNTAAKHSVESDHQSGGVAKDASEGSHGSGSVK